jgi:hypothetical protein
MKKTILLLLFICALGSTRLFAQNEIEITDLSSNIVTGTTLTVDTSDITAVTMDVYLNVTNNTDQDINLYVRRIINSEVASSANSFCFGICYPVTTDTSLNSVLVTPGHSTTFSGDYSPNSNPGTTSITYEFYDNRTFSSPITAQVTVKYHLSPLSVGSELKSFDISSAFPNPASSSTSLGYTLPAGSEGKILVRNLVGNIVRAINLDKPEGKALINTSDLSDGLYFYSVMLNNKVELTRKLIIRH